MNRRGFITGLFAVALAPGAVLDVVRPGAVIPVSGPMAVTPVMWSDEIMRQYKRNTLFSKLIEGGGFLQGPPNRPWVKSPGVPSSPPTAGVPRPEVPSGPGLF